MALELLAHEIAATEGVELRPATATRDWLSAIPHGFANRCLPMLMANSLGWDVVTTHAYRLYLEREEVKVEHNDPRGRPLVGPMHHFGFGIATWSLPWLFTTPPEWDLLVMPSANRPLDDNVMVLSGLVETDHSHESFTLNWALKHGADVQLVPGDVIATLLPYPTGLLTMIKTRVTTEPKPGHVQWARERAEFNASDRGPNEWQRSYSRGAKRRKLTLPGFAR